jgi:ATP synthase protein I
MVDDARILVRSAIAVAVTGLVLVVVGAVVVGGKGALGAALGVALVAAFFTLSVVTVSLAERWWGPTAMTAAALGTFLVKVLAVMAIVAAFRDTTLFDTRLFGLAAIAGILVWSTGQVVTLARRRVLYVQPDSDVRSRP